MGFWSGLGKVLGAVGPIAAAPFTGGGSLAALPAILGAGGAALGAASQSSANNRGEKFGGQMDLEALLMQRDQMFQNQQIAREQEGRAGSSDAWRKLLSTSRVLSPGTRPQLSPYSKGPRAITREEQEGAGALQAEVLKRLQGGNPMPQVQQRPMNVDPKLLDAGLFEKIAGFASPALGMWSKLRSQPYEATY